MKCRRHLKCKSILIREAENKDYICCGIQYKPTKFKDDTICLCLKGQYGDLHVELTRKEAVEIIHCLSARLLHE
jgi:hypothetical protein